MSERANLVGVVDVVVHCGSCLGEAHPDVAADALGDARKDEPAELARPGGREPGLAAPREHAEPAAHARDAVQARAVERACELCEAHAALVLRADHEKVPDAAEMIAKHGFRDGVGQLPQEIHNVCVLV